MLHQTTEPTAVHVLRPEVPEELSRLVATMLAKKPADRPQTGEQTAAALQRWVDPSSRTALQPSAQTLTDLRIDPATGVLFTSKGALASPGRIAASTVMVEEDDTLALDPRQKRGLVASRPTPTRHVPRLAHAERRKPKGSPLALTMIGLAIGLGLGLAVGLAGACWRGADAVTYGVIPGTPISRLAQDHTPIGRLAFPIGATPGTPISRLASSYANREIGVPAPDWPSRAYPLFRQENPSAPLAEALPCSRPTNPPCLPVPARFRPRRLAGRRRACSTRSRSPARPGNS